MLLLNRDIDINNEVTTMTSSCQCTKSCGCLVNRAHVRVSMVNLRFLFRHDVNSLHFAGKNLRKRFIQSSSFFIPAASFNEKSINVNTIFGMFGKISFYFIIDNLEGEVNCIDSNSVLPSIVLFSTS